jgi:hypothetical protein
MPSYNVVTFNVGVTYSGHVYIIHEMQRPHSYPSMQWRILLERTVVGHLVKEFPASYATQRFMTVVTWVPRLVPAMS